jgi:uncharacterized repeat protein (TIGR03803 family)
VNGVLYGTTYGGGKYYDGTVFEVTPAGTDRVLYSFAGAANGDGSYPNAGLLDVNGALYGTTSTGGKYTAGYPYGEGKGTAFAVTPSGKEVVLHSFGNKTDGQIPDANLIDVNGILYGVTHNGGSGTCTSSEMANGCGTVFAITTSGAERVIHSFLGGSDGSFPYVNLINVNGVVYGTTAGGGQYNCGTVFAVTLNGNYRVLYNFAGGAADGAAPGGGLIDVKGVLYGTTFGGGRYDAGTVFAVTADGTERVLYNFAGGAADGAAPGSGLIDVKGVLYGTTYFGGEYKKGTVFAVTLAGKEVVLHSFGNGIDGAFPEAGLINVNGVLYGTTNSGGQYNPTGQYGDGTIFAITTSGTERVLHSFGGLTPIASAPPATTSLYVQWTKNGPLSALANYGYAMAHAGLSGLVVLDFGQPTVQGGAYGTWSKIEGLSPSKYPFVSIPQITNAVEAYLDGYYQGRTNSKQQLELAVGTNNFCLTIIDCKASWWKAHGTAWATMINTLAGYIFGNGRSAQESVAGANDIEIAWGAVNTKAGVTATYNWLDGYNATTKLPMYDFGSLDTCQKGGCPNWSPLNLWAVSSSGDSYALPEIYCPGQATDWDQLAAWSIKNGHGQLRIAGTMTSPLTPPGTPPCLSKPYTAAQGFDLLWDLLARDALGTENSLVESTNIIYSTK